MSRQQHDRMVVVDALEYSNWDRESFEEMRRGGISAVNVTLVIWENARETLDVIGKWHQRFREYSDLIMPVRAGEDILAAKAAGKVGIIFGTQNASLFEDDLSLVSVFHALGIRIVQLTYNIQNLVGTSCYEPDGGLSRFGKLVVAEMNRLGMVIDGSHVGERTTMDAIEHSSRPVAITHANPKSFKDHPRNKSDELLKKLAARGGILGVAPYPHLTGGTEITLDQYVEMIKRTVDLIGIEHVGIGSDASRKWSDEYLMWIRMGRWTIEPEYGAGTKERPEWLPWPKFFQTPADFPNLTEGMLRGGFSEEDAARVIGGNWLRFFTEGFKPAA